MYRGHEDDVFKSAQPNLFCNTFYWVDEPEKRWPDKIWLCPQASKVSSLCLVMPRIPLPSLPRLLSLSPDAVLVAMLPLCAPLPQSDPPMHCSDSFYCNWTNNPQLWSVAWWNREYVEGSFQKRNSIDPFADIEYWTNWDQTAWNTRKFTVAQGDGLFKHIDRGNFGAV